MKLNFLKYLPVIVMYPILEKDIAEKMLAILKVIH